MVVLLFCAGNAFADSYQAVVDDETESNENPIAFDHENSPSSQFESGDYLGMGQVTCWLLD